MSIPVAEDIFRWKGRIVKAPSVLTGDYPYGGTGLGVITNARIVPGMISARLPSDGWGGQTAEVVTQASQAVILGLLRSDDDDFLSWLYPDTAAGAISGRRVVNHRVKNTSTGEPTIGRFASDDSVQLAFVPDDDDRMPWIIFYNAMAVPEEAAEIPLSPKRPHELRFAIHCGIDASFRTWSRGRRVDLSL